MGVQKTAPDASNYIVEEELVSVDERPAQTTSTAVQAGWEAASTLTTAAGDYPVDFVQSETPQVIKFLDQEGPFASYRQHFLQNKAGRKSYICLGNHCPLCIVLKHKPEDKRAFTIANLSAEGGIQRQRLIATPRLYKTLHAAHFSPQGPLPKHYWSLSRSGKMQSTTYHLQAIKARDLLEDWNIDPEVSEPAISKMECFERSSIRESSYAELLEIAEEVMS
jgi:hypothetical protein